VPEPAIQVDSVTVRYGSGAASACAIRDVSAQLEAGQITLIMGPSGSGKTTLLSAIAGLLRPESGSITAFGTRISELSPRDSASFRRRDVGFVFQAFRLFRSLTTLENVALAMSVAGQRPDHESALEALDSVGMRGKAGARIWQLSGGQKQRVAIARALVNQPRLIFADEPTAALDSRTIDGVAAILREQAHARGRLVLAVTHDPRLVPIADRVLRLEDGRLDRGRIRS
jgi:putative ABC transport system ATP-binding protein